MLAAIDDLSKLRLIHRDESGRQFLCRINRDHPLVEAALVPLFSAESTWPTMLFAAIRKGLASFGKTAINSPTTRNFGIVAAWIFGSAAKGTDKPGSDLDVFILMETEKSVEPMVDHVSECLPIWHREFGTDVRPVVMSLKRVRTELRDQNNFLINAIRYSRMVSGEIPFELKHGKANSDAKSR